MLETPLWNDDRVFSSNYYQVALIIIFHYYTSLLIIKEFAYIEFSGAVSGREAGKAIAQRLATPYIEVHPNRYKEDIRHGLEESAGFCFAWLKRHTRL